MIRNVSTNDTDFPRWIRSAALAINGLISTVYSYAVSFGNPTLPGGLIAPNDGISLTSQIDSYSLSGTRSKAQIGRTIQVTDDQIGPPSSAGVNTADSASYGLAITGYRPSWATSALTGEMDGISILLRQARGDTAGILSNIAVQSGYAATLESITLSADSSGAAINAVRTQIGVANPRDGEYFGYVAIAETGANLTAALHATSSIGSSWDRYILCTTSAGGVDFSVKGNTVETTFLSLVPSTFAALTAAHPAASSAGIIARINDASAPITMFGQVVSSGGGSNTALVTSNGTNYVAIST